MWRCYLFGPCFHWGVGLINAVVQPQMYGFVAGGVGQETQQEVVESVGVFTNISICAVDAPGKSDKLSQTPALKRMILRNK